MTYTLVPDQEAQSYVQEVIETIVEEILAKTGTANCVAILLIGSFGCGEGGVKRRGDGWAIVNDIELDVIQHVLEPAQLQDLSQQLAQRFGIYKVDIGAKSVKQLEAMDYTMFTYDYRYGSQVVYGDVSVLNVMRDYDPAEMPVWEGARLLLNRGGGLIMHFTLPRYLRRNQFSEDVRQVLKNQLVKTAVALGDALIVCQRRYHHSYKVRWDIFKELASNMDSPLTEDSIALINQCYEEKLYPGSYEFEDLFARYSRLLRAYNPVFIDVMSVYFGSTLADLDAYWQRMVNSSQMVSYNRPSILRNTLRVLKRAVRTQRLPTKDEWIRRAAIPDKVVYAAIPLVLNSAPFLTDATPEYLVTAERLLTGSKLFGIQRKENFEGRWERTREVCFKYWYATCH